MGVIHHIDFAVADLALSRAFYERALAPLGLEVSIATLTRFTALPYKRVAGTMARPACGRDTAKTGTPRSSSIRMDTTSKRFAVAPEGELT